MVKNNPGSCDAVWFATAYGYPKMSTHTQNSKRMYKIAQMLKEAGIGISLQFSNSIGHGEYIKNSRDCSGLVYEGSPARGLVGHDGLKTDCSFCWRDDYFKNYLCDQIKEYLIIKPDYLWIVADACAANVLITAIYDSNGDLIGVGTENNIGSYLNKSSECVFTAGKTPAKIKFIVVDSMNSLIPYGSIGENSFTVPSAS